MKKAQFRRSAESNLPTIYGDFKIYVYENVDASITHFAVVKGDIQGQSDVLCRIHSSCITGDILGSYRCDCGEQLHYSLKEIDKNNGIVIYLFQEGRGIGLKNKIKAYKLQENGLDTIEANHRLGLPTDARSYEMVGDILNDFKVKSIHLMTNNPEKINSLKIQGIKISGLRNIPVTVNEHNKKYLETKKDKLNHILLPKTKEFKVSE